MFSKLFKYWSNVTDSPSILFKLNLWTFANIRFFKFKFSRNLYFFITGLSGLRVNELKIFYKDWIFEDFYLKFFKFNVFIIFLFFLI